VTVSAKDAGRCSGQRAQAGQLAPLLLAGGPVGGQHVGQLRPVPTGGGQVAEPEQLLGHLDERVGPAHPGGAVVVVALPAGERLQDGQDRLAVLAGEHEPAAHRAVGVAGELQVPAGSRSFDVGLERGFAVRRDQVPHPGGQLRRVPARRDLDQLRLRVEQVLVRDPADEPCQHRRLRLGQHPAEHRGDHSRQRPQRRRRPQLAARGARGRPRRLRDPAGD
jgi:hypothetical protein